MKIAIFVLLCLFVAANVWVEAQNEGAEAHWWNEPLSWYLSGRLYSWTQSAAYLGLVAAECLIVVAYGVAGWQRVAIVVGAAGLFGVTLTANMRGRLDFSGRRLLHQACAAAAFGGMIAFEALYLRHTPSIWFPIGAVAVAAAFLVWARGRTALQEKAITLFAVAAMVPIVAPPL